MKWLSGFIILLWSFSLSAQLIEVSNPYRLPNKAGRFRVIGKNNDGVIVRLYGAEDIIDVFDEKMKLVTGKTIAFRNQNGLLQHIMLNKNGAVIFYLTQEKKYSVLLAQPVSSKFVEIGKPMSIDTLYDKKDLVASNLRFRTSMDQAHLMIYYPFFSGNKLESVKFISVDRSLNKSFMRTVAINRDERELEDSKALIDNSGNSYFIVRPPDRDGKSFYDVFRLSSEGVPSNFRITTERAVFGDPSFDIDSKNENLTVCGFLGEITPAGESAATGVFYASYEPVEGKVVTSQYIPFPNDFMVKLTGRQPGDKARLYTFNVRKAILRNDGGVVVLAESFIKDSREIPVATGFQPGFSTYRTTETFQFNDVIAFSIEPTGQLTWSTVLRKKQMSEDDNGAYSSFLIMNEKDKLRLLYLDDILNGGMLNQFILNSDGTIDKKTVMNQDEKDVLMLPKMGRQITPNQVVIPSYKDNSLRMVKITF